MMTTYVCMGEECICKVCGYRWTARYKKLPIQCAGPDCHSDLWNVGYNAKCEVCGRVPFIPRIHHKNRDHEDNREKNRIILCEDCHLAIHSYPGRKKGISGNKHKRRAYPIGHNLGKYTKNPKQTLQNLEIRKKIKKLQRFL